MLEPGFERLDDRPGAILARPPAQFGRQPAYLVLDRIELLDACKRLRRDRAMAAEKIRRAPNYSDEGKTRNPAWVQKALGHADIKTTMRHYAHVLNDDVRQAKAEVQEAQAASPTVQKLQGKLQGRRKMKLVG